MPPTRPPIVGRLFHNASDTVRPNPSRIDFWMQTAACTWKAFTSTAPTLFRLENMKMSGSSLQYSWVRFQYSQPSGSACAIEPTSANRIPGWSRFTSGQAALTRGGEVEHLGLRRGEIDVTPPHPVRPRGLHELGDRDRLRVVHDDDVPLVGVGERIRIQLVVAVEDRALAVGERPLVALERVVD